MPEDVNEQLIDEQDLAEAEQVESNEVYAEESVMQPEPAQDWRVQAMQDPRVRERFDAALLGGQQEAAAPPPVDPVMQAKERLQEINNSMPQLDEKNMTAQQVTAFLSWQNDRAAAQQAVYDAELQRTQYEVQAQRAKSTLEDYISQSRTADPAFKDYERQFREFVRANNIDPRLLENRTVVDMIRKSIGYDHVATNRKAKRPGAPPVDEAYARQGRSRRARQEEQQLREPTDLDRDLAAFYRMPVEQLIKGESELGGDAERWSMKGAVQWSSEEKLRRARIRR